MGHPKRQEKKYSRPQKPYDKDRIEREKKLEQDYGLRRKKEIWRAEGVLRDFRGRARDLQAHHDKKKEKDLIEKLNKLGIKCQTLDDILEANLNDLLSRRLQTIVHKKGLAHSPRQARQLIVHGHILVDRRRIRWPSYIIKQEEEGSVSLSPKIKTAVMEKEKNEKEEAKS
ncbi:MAG: 30S ribosomal protein S4 [Candidatus Aenigmarchaeota archaeon]|nr:30S ribosomal protein S4 [Candidatus Aenigmarchaeota archaeon]